MDTSTQIVFHLANLAVGIIAVIGGVATAIANYFWLHSDTHLTTKQMWEHIAGLLFFFFFGMLLFGLVAWCVMRLLGVHL